MLVQTMIKQVLMIVLLLSFIFTLSTSFARDVLTLVVYGTWAHVAEYGLVPTAQKWRAVLCLAAACCPGLYLPTAVAAAVLCESLIGFAFVFTLNRCDQMRTDSTIRGSLLGELAVVVKARAERRAGQQLAKKRSRGKSRNIFVRCLDGKMATLQMKKHNTVADLKAAIWKRKRVPVEQQARILANPTFANVLSDDATLASAGCFEGATAGMATVGLVLKSGLCGGMGCGPSKPGGDDSGEGGGDEHGFGLHGGKTVQNPAFRSDENEDGVLSDAYSAMGRLKMIQLCKKAGLDYVPIAKDAEALRGVLRTSAAVEDGIVGEVQRNPSATAALPKAAKDLLNARLKQCMPMTSVPMMTSIANNVSIDINDEVEVLEAAKSSGVSLLVAKAIINVLDENKSIDEEFNFVMEHDTVSPKFNGIATANAIDGIGVLVLMCISYELQLADIDAKEYSLEKYQTAAKKPIEKLMYGCRKDLQSAINIMTSDWNVDEAAISITAKTALANFKKLPLSGPVDKKGNPRTSAQSVIGSIAFDAGPAPSTYAVKRMGYAPLSLAEQGRVFMGKKSKQRSQLKLRNETRTGLAAAVAVKKSLLAADYETRRIAQTRVVSRAVLADIDRFGAAYAKEVLRPGATAALALLDAFGHRAPSTINGAKVTLENLPDITWDPAVPPDMSTTSLEYIALARYSASRASLAVYLIVTTIVQSVVDPAGKHGVLVIPGPVKGWARIVFKSILNYSLDFSLCKDLARITVVAKDLAVLADVVSAVYASPLLHVVRTKNRFSQAYDTRPVAGYRDYQIVALVEIGDCWKLVEIQVNLDVFVAMKGESHKVFEEARALEVFSKHNSNFYGNADEGVIEKIASGVLLKATFLDTIPRHLVGALGKALGAKSSRLQELNCPGRGLGDAGIALMAAGLEQNKELQVLNLASNDIGTKGIAKLGAVLKINKTLIELNLRGNDSMWDQVSARAFAEGLKINTSLKRLDLCGTSLGSYVKYIAEALETNEALEDLDLVLNDISNADANMLADSLKLNDTLQHLNVDSNPISDGGRTSNGNKKLRAVWTRSGRTQWFLIAGDHAKFPDDRPAGYIPRDGEAMSAEDLDVNSTSGSDSNNDSDNDFEYDHETRESAARDNFFSSVGGTLESMLNVSATFGSGGGDNDGGDGCATQ